MRKIDEDLVKACRTGQIGIVKLLLEYGADAHADSCLLAVAGNNNHLEIVRLLLERESWTEGSLWFALRGARRFRHQEVVNLLLDHGASFAFDLN